jgi:hypothetical protein
MCVRVQSRDDIPGTLCSIEIEINGEKEMTDPASTTYYLLRTKQSTAGNGPYVGHDADGDLILVTGSENARHFDSLDAADQFSMRIHEQFNGLETEVRNCLNQ